MALGGGVTPAFMLAPKKAKRRTWRCFYCDEVFFSAETAGEHFGAEGEKPGCVEKLSGGDQHLLRALRKARRREREAFMSLQNEDSDVMRWASGLKSEHETALRRAEEEGYAKGLRDARIPWYDIKYAPKDRFILVWCPAYEGLPEIISVCLWHPDAGFCVDELRTPTLYAEIGGERMRPYLSEQENPKKPPE